MELDDWLRALTAGLFLSLLAFGAVIGFNTISPFIGGFIESATGLTQPSFIALLILVFLVGFSVAARKAPPENIVPGTPAARGLFTTGNERVVSLVNQNKIEEIEIVEESYVGYLADRTIDLPEDSEIILKVQLQPKGGRNRDTLLYYLEKLQKFSNFRYVVFTDRFNRFLFYAKAKELKSKIEPIKGAYIMDLINAMRVEELRQEDFIHAHTVSYRLPNIRALKIMVQENLNEVMVVSQGWSPRYIGVLEMRDLLKMMLAHKESTHAKTGSMMRRAFAIGPMQENVGIIEETSKREETEGNQVSTTDAPKEIGVAPPVPYQRS